jgi:hypothetical protein
MPDGMAALFDGKYFWRMPQDVEIDVGPTIIHASPKNYRDATERYSSQDSGTVGVRGSLRATRSALIVVFARHQNYQRNQRGSRF